MALFQKILGLKHRNTHKIVKNLVHWNSYAQILEMCYEALPGGPVPSCFQMKVSGTKMAVSFSSKI